MSTGGRATIKDLISTGADEAPAIGAPGRLPLRFAELRILLSKTVLTLNGCGVGRNDCVAIVLPNGPEMAAAFVALSAGATTAPLNPAYRRAELRFYLSDLAPKLLVTEAGTDSPAVTVAEELGIPVARLHFDPTGPAGLFELEAVTGATGTGGFARAEDIALILHTSGTTSRPKIVPLTQRNVCSSALHIAQSLLLMPQDRCLNIMPLFHIHGLVAAVLASLGTGASVHCTDGFNALKFFRWLGEIRPSWFTGVPTMHHAILARAAQNAGTIAKAPLRLIRSSSASLPVPVMEGLEAAFDVPVIEAYGMTEAAHQIASNPVPPGERKPGTVGPEAGPEVCIFDEAGDALGPGLVGEVAIRGPNVSPGYRDNPEANAEAFVDGWFRTGDLGCIDEDGYLKLTGRIKEIINRGGEKISPREVDDVLIGHPAVAEVVTFALPHDKLGEDVAAAIVLREDARAEPAEIRAFAAEKLAAMKVPRNIYILEEIPTGPTGKLQRIGLAGKLGLA